MQLADGSAKSATKIGRLQQLPSIDARSIPRRSLRRCERLRRRGLVGLAGACSVRRLRRGRHDDCAAADERPIRQIGGCADIDLAGPGIHSPRYVAVRRAQCVRVRGRDAARSLHQQSVLQRSMLCRSCNLLASDRLLRQAQLRYFAAAARVAEALDLAFGAATE